MILNKNLKNRSVSKMEYIRKTQDLKIKYELKLKLAFRPERYNLPYILFIKKWFKNLISRN